MRTHSWLLAGFLLAGCAAPSPTSPQADAWVSGTVTHRQRVALPPAAVLEVRLLEMTGSSPTGRVIATQTARTDGRQAPLPFELRYDPRQIREGHPVGVEARILVDGQVRFRNRDAYAIYSAGRASGIEILLEAAP